MSVSCMICLHSAGVKTIHEISRCKDYEEYQTMSEANFNLVLHPEARFAAEDFHNRLQIPFIELRRLYQTDKIASQYQAFGRVLGVDIFRWGLPQKSRRCRGKIQRKTAGCKLCDWGMHERGSI